MATSNSNVFKAFVVSLYVLSIVFNIWCISTLFHLIYQKDHTHGTSEGANNTSLIVEHSLAAAYCYLGIVLVVLQSYKSLVWYTISQLLLALVFILSSSTNRYTGPLASIALLSISILYLIRYKNRKLDSVNFATSSSKYSPDIKLSIFFSVLIVILYSASVICVALFTMEEVEFLQGQLSSVAANEEVKKYLTFRVEIVSKSGMLLTGLIFIFLVTSLCNLLARQDQVMENLSGMLAMLLLVLVSFNSSGFFYIAAIATLTIFTSIFAESLNFNSCEDVEQYGKRSFGAGSNCNSSSKAHSVTSNREGSDTRVDSPLMAAT